jgi:hypothetical protein
MATTTETVYMNGATLATSTALFTDADLTICASDGWYSDGTVIRQLLGCVLGNPRQCDPCGFNCDASPFLYSDARQNLYTIETNLGAATGAIVVTIDPRSIPKGVRVTYDGTVYNKFSSEDYGLLESATSGNFTVMGRSSSACLNIADPTTYYLSEYQFNGSTFVSVPNAENITLNSTDLQLTANQPNDCVLVIPKTAGTPDTLNIEITAQCPYTGTQSFEFTVACATSLTSFSASAVQANSVDACAASLTSTFYLVDVSGGAATFPGLHDYVFDDADAVTASSDGYYAVDSGNSYIQVENGIVIATGSCP